MYVCVFVCGCTVYVVLGVWVGVCMVFALKDFDEFRNVFIAKLRYYPGLRLYGCGCMDACVRVWMYCVRVCGWMRDVYEWVYIWV